MAPETRAGNRKKKPTVSRPAAFSLARPLQKNYAVGLEMQCPAGACYWAPEIPSGRRLAEAIPSKYELVHNHAHP